MYGQLEHHQSRNRQSVNANQSEGAMSVSQEISDWSAGGVLPPIRRINNHLPPRHLRLPSIKLSSHSNSRNFIVGDKNNIHMSHSGAQSVLNLSASVSESDGSFTDGNSIEAHTSYTYAEDDHPATNMQCMNSFFFPPAEEHEGNDSGIIRCHRVGPSSAELQLNITLPSRYKDHLPPVPEDQNSKYMSNLCQAPSLNFNVAQFDSSLEESVVEVDPYKQFRERVAPQFYESLIEELSDEDGNSESEDGDSIRQRDNSQIFGELDAHRNAWQDTLYNEMFLHESHIDSTILESPPSQIFVIESQEPSTEMTPNAEDQSHDVLNAIEVNLNGSSDVFSGPQDGQDSSLNNHLRESADVGTNTLVLKVYGSSHSEASSQVQPDLHGMQDASPEHRVEPAPSIDEPMTPLIAERMLYATRMGMSKEEKDTKGRTRDDSTCSPRSVDSVENARSFMGHSETDEVEVVEESPSDQQPILIEQPTFQGPMEAIDASLHAFPSFDEPGRITVQNTKQVVPPPITAPELAKDQTLIGHSEEDGHAAPTSIYSHHSASKGEDVPDDEEMGIPVPELRINVSKGSLDPSVDVEEVLVDENTVIAGNNDPLRPHFSVRRSPRRRAEILSSPGRDGDAEEDDLDRQPAGPVMRTSVLNARRFRRSVLEETSTPNEKAETPGPPKKLDDPAWDSSYPAQPHTSRLILEETSKANIRTEVYETNPSYEKQMKTARELRKHRIRPTDQERPPSPTRTVVSVRDRASSELSCARNLLKSVDEDEKSRDESQDDAPDLDDLLEFHSCEEEGFTMHARGEFVTGFPSDF